LRLPDQFRTYMKAIGKNTVKTYKET